MFIWDQYKYNMETQQTGKHLEDVNANKLWKTKNAF